MYNRDSKMVGYLKQVADYNAINWQVEASFRLHTPYPQA